MEQMLLAGMNVARLNSSHGSLESHGRVIDTLRSACRATGRRGAILADLSGPTIRIGELEEEPVTAHRRAILSAAEEIVRSAERHDPLSRAGVRTTLGERTRSLNRRLSRGRAMAGPHAAEPSKARGACRSEQLPI